MYYIIVPRGAYAGFDERYRLHFAPILGNNLETIRGNAKPFYLLEQALEVAVLLRKSYCAVEVIFYDPDDGTFEEGSSFKI